MHIYRDNKLVCKWDIENNTELVGKASRGLKTIIKEVLKEKQILKWIDNYEN